MGGARRKAGLHATLLTAPWVPLTPNDGSFGSFGFLFLKFHTANFPKKKKKKKGSTPHPSPTLSSEPSERKPRSHATRPVWLRLRFGASAQRFRQPGLLPGVPALLGSRKLSQCLYFQTWMPAPRPLSAFTSQGAPELKEKKMVPGAQLFRGRFS